MKYSFAFLTVIFLLCFSLFKSEKAFSQTDTEFWFAAPEVSEGIGAFGGSLDRPIFLRITTLNQASTVTVTQPANPLFPTRIINIAANSVATIDLTADIATIENKPPDVVNKWGLHITATTPVNIYYEVASNQVRPNDGLNPDVFFLKGSTALGTDFFTPFQNFLPNAYNYIPTPYSSFDIIATQDATTVTITPKHDIIGHVAGSTFTILLNKGETYSAQAVSQLQSEHLGGSRVTSDKPIAITIKDDLLYGGVYGGCLDLMGDQIIPVNRLGRNYVAVKGYLNTAFSGTPEKAFVIASQNGTAVNVDGSNVATINAGETYVVDINNPTTFISTSLNAYVLQMSGTGCEVGGAVLPSLDCAGSNQVGFTRTNPENFYINILARAGTLNSFTYNGAPGLITAADFQVVPNTSGWYYAKKSLSTSDLAVGGTGIIANSAGIFQLSMIHGGNNTGTRFSYLSDFQTCVAVTVAQTTSVKCYGQNEGTATISVTGGTGPYTYTLTGGATPVSGSIAANTTTLTNLSAGNYEIDVTDATLINAAEQAFTIAQPSAPLSITPAITNVSCNGGTNGAINLTVTGGTAPYIYAWTGASFNSSSKDISGLKAGTYSLTVTDANGAGCGISKTYSVGEPTPLNVSYSNLQNVNCTTGAKGSVIIAASGGTAPYTGVGTFSNLSGGTYTYTVTDAKGCSNHVTVNIVDNCACTNTTQHTETFPSQYNTGFTRSLSNKTFAGSSGTWTANSNANATIVVLQPYYSPSTSYALKIVNYKTQNCSGTGTCSAASPKLNLTGACCPAELKLNFTLWTYNCVSGDTKASLDIDFSSDNGATWNEVWSQTSAQLFSSYGANSKTNISVAIPSAYQNTNFKYRFRGEMAAGDNNNFYLFIDDISIKSPASCTPNGSIGNYVWYDVNGNGIQDGSESGLAGVTVKLTYPNSTTVIKVTDANGAYLFTNLPAGTYSVTFTTPSGYVSSPSNQGVNDATDSDPVGGIVSVTLAQGQNNTNTDAGFDLPACTNTTQHTETYPSQYNTGFTRSLVNKTFAGSSGTWTANSNANATIVAVQPYYSPSTSYALKIVNYKTQGCSGAGSASATSPVINLTNACCPSQLTLNLTLWTYTCYANDNNSSVKLDFSSNNGSTWTEIVSATSSQLYYSYGSNGKAAISIPIPAAYQTANFRYRFRGEMCANNSYNFFLFADDINIKSPAACSSTPSCTNSSVSNPDAATLPVFLKSEVTTTVPEVTIVAEVNKPVIAVNQPEIVLVPAEIQVSPNPSFGQFKVALNNFKGSKAEVLLISEKGVVVAKQSVQLSGKQRITDFNVRNLAAGVYHIRVISEDGVQNAKVIIQH